MIRLSDAIPRIPEFAHYYGDWIWDEALTDWIKLLLLFFDGIALGIPAATADRLIESDPILAQPLAELGLLHNYWPDVWPKIESQFSSSRRIEPVDKFFDKYFEYFEQIPEFIRFITPDSRDSESNVSRAFDMLDDLGRAWRDFGDTDSNRLALAAAGISRLLLQHVTDVALQPVIDNENAASFVAAIIGSHDAGRAKIVIGDLAQVGIDLSAVPLDEVLHFRSQYGSEYRRYSADVRKFVLELSLMDEASRRSAVMERRAELDERAEQLRKIGRTAFARQTIGFGFGLAGAAWTLVHGDPWGASFAAGAVAAGLTRQDPEQIGASYTYILRAKTELRR
jgi:hypothetical protein